MYSATSMRMQHIDCSVVNYKNRDLFIQQITSKGGYFLISIFEFDHKIGENNLDDAILQGLVNGIVLNLSLFTF